MDSLYALLSDVLRDCVYPFCNQQQKDISNEGICDKLLCSIGVFFFFSFSFLSSF